MSNVGSRFRSWLLAQRPCGAVPIALDDDRIRIVTDHATAEVNFYSFDGEEIVEYLIVRTSEEDPTFFLHFMLDDMIRAKDLFGQMAEALADEANSQLTHVLLCCTSAMTTTMFASKMEEVSRAVKLDYTFEAMDVGNALATSNEYAAVLLAPQVAHLRSQMAQAHPEAVVFEVPGKIFGKYDAAGAIRLLSHALREAHEPSESGQGLNAVRALDDDRQVLVITLFFMRDYAQLGYRLYDRGIQKAQGSVRKPRLDFRDIGDLVQTLSAHTVDISQLDAIGIAVPGVTYMGSVTLPDRYEESFNLGQPLSERFGLPVYVENNCNAAATACYVTQDEHESLVFFRQGFGHTAGGFGTIIDGRLLKGRANLAGEPKYFERRFDLGAPYEDALWTAEGMHELAKDVVLTSLALISPDAVYLAVDTVDDAEEFRASLAQDIDEEFVPPVYIVDDYVERVYLGELALCLQKLRDPQYRSLGVGYWEHVKK